MPALEITRPEGPAATGRGRRRLRDLVAALLTALLLGLAAPVLAQDARSPGQAGLDTGVRDRLQEEIAAQEARLSERRTEIAAIEEQLGNTRARLDAQIVERDRVVAELLAVRNELDVIRADIVVREDELSATRARIAERQADLALMEVRIQGLVFDLYRQRSNRFARVLVNAASFHDLRVQNRYLAFVAEQDVAVVNDLNAILTELAELQAVLSQQITELQAREGERDQAQTRLEATRSELQALINELDATREGQLAQQRALLQTEQQLEGLLSVLANDLETEIASLEQQAQINREQAADFLRNNPPAPLGSPTAGTACADAAQVALPAPLLSSGFIFPVEGARITRPFGQGNNSYLGLSALQPSAAVRSVQSGAVSSARFLSANDGYLVVVLHGDGLASAYLNLRAPLVGEGDRVVQGQLIGCLGGGALNPEDLLKLYISVTNNEGRTVQIDPVAALGLNP